MSAACEQTDLCLSEVSGNEIFWDFFIVDIHALLKHLKKWEKSTFCINNNLRCVLKLNQKIYERGSFPHPWGNSAFKNPMFLSQLLLELMLSSQLPFESLMWLFLLCFWDKAAFANSGKFSGVLVMLHEWLA